MKNIALDFYLLFIFFVVLYFTKKNINYFIFLHKFETKAI